MGRATIPVDLRNPGQVFACLGFLEAADLLCGPAEGGFDWTGDEVFVLDAEGAENPVKEVLTFLVKTEVVWQSPSASLSERDGGRTVVVEGVAPSKAPKPADLPGFLVGKHHGTNIEIGLGWWADGTGRFSESFKKSTFANSSHTRIQNALDAISTLDSTLCGIDPFGQSAVTKSLFRLDPRGSTDPINDGTSPDTLRKGGIEMRVATYPVCELLAILGLQNARPEIVSRTCFAYRVWGDLKCRGHGGPVMLPPLIARAAVGSAIYFIQSRRFLVGHDEVKPGGDRRFTSITEDT